MIASIVGCRPLSRHSSDQLIVAVNQRVNVHVHVYVHLQVDVQVDVQGTCRVVVINTNLP